MNAICEICGEPMPDGEEMFKFHGYSGNCPKPPLAKEQAQPVPARKVGGSYQANGFIVARFRTRSGAERVVFEFSEPAGMLHIFSASQVELCDTTDLTSPRSTCK